MDVLGEWLSPLEVVAGASKGVHGVTSGVAFVKEEKEQDTSTSLFFGAPDSPVVNFNNGAGDGTSEPRPHPMPLLAPLDPTRGISFALYKR